MELHSAGAGTVLWGCDGRGVATLRFNRPAVNNAYNGDLIAGLHEAMDGLGADSSVRVVVLSGAGRHFQAGADLKWIAGLAGADSAANLRASRATAEAVRRLEMLPVATLALVQGGCFGGGTGMVAACDMVFAARDAVFSITEVRWGLTPAIILAQLSRAMGLRQVRRYALSCERFSAQEAWRVGLVHQVCDDLAAEGEAMVNTLLMNAPLALAATKRRALALAQCPMQEHEFDELVREHTHFRRQPEAREGTASFIEKRAPAWYPGTKLP